MVRRFYICGANNVGDPAVGASSITDPYFDGKNVTGVFKEGFRYFIPDVEWSFSGTMVTVSNGTKFARDEVFIVEVSPVKTGVTCSGLGTECTDVAPYLPDIIKCAVARVNTVFETRDDDPFSVQYGHGLYQQVGTDKLSADPSVLLVWLVMPFNEEIAQLKGYYSDANCKIVIAIKTDHNYSQQQREEINFHPRLIPVYNQLIQELKEEPKLNNSTMVEHTRVLLPYWGGGDVAEAGQPNLWKNYVDAIEIYPLKLQINNSCCNNQL